MNEPQFTGSTLPEVKTFLTDNWNKGVHCPCCKQFVKLYVRPISSSMACALIYIYRYFAARPTDQWVHIGDYLNSLDIAGSIRNTGDVSKLKYWGLIKEKTELRDDESPRNGYYRMTADGANFVLGLLAVPSHIRLYNDKFYGFTGEYITIGDALKQKFNYRELMGQYYHELHSEPDKMVVGKQEELL